MSNKKSISQLQERIRAMIKEEVAEALLEEINPLFRRLRNKKAFSAWVMRQFFAAKHKNKPWYDPSVNEENVLERVTELSEKGLFPTTPKALVGTWKMKAQLNKSMGAMDREEKAELKRAAQADIDADSSKVKYKTGEVSLKDIGQELGGVTATMINKIGKKAMDNFSTLNFGKRPDSLTPDEKEKQNEIINNARIEAADEYVDLLFSAASIEDFFMTLKSKMVLSPMDLKTRNPEEVDGLEILLTKDPDRVKLILLQDIEEDDNLFKSFQSMVYRKIFPPGKRGAPKKVVD